MLPREVACIIRVVRSMACQKCSRCVICGTSQRGESKETVRWNARKFRCARERFHPRRQTPTWPSRCTRALSDQEYCRSSWDKIWRSWRSIRWWVRPCFWTWISMIVRGRRHALTQACNAPIMTFPIQTKMARLRSNYSRTISMCLKIREIWV